MAALNRYGKRDSVLAGVWVTRPDGSMFQQLHEDSYRRIQVPMVPPPETRSGKLGGVPRATAKEGTMVNTMAQSQLDLGTITYTVVDRQLSENGRAWLLTVRGPSGKEAVVSRLRSSREGNGF